MRLFNSFFQKGRRVEPVRPWWRQCRTIHPWTSAGKADFSDQMLISDAGGKGLNFLPVDAATEKAIAVLSDLSGNSRCRSMLTFGSAWLHHIAVTRWGSRRPLNIERLKELKKEEVTV